MRLRHRILKHATSISRPQAPDLRFQISASRPQTSDVTLRTSDVRRQASDFRRQTTHLRLQSESESTLQASNLRPQRSELALQTLDCGFQTKDFRPQISGFRPQTSGVRLPISDCRLWTSGLKLQISVQPFCFRPLLRNPRNSSQARGAEGAPCRQREALPRGAKRRPPRPVPAARPKFGPRRHLQSQIARHLVGCSPTLENWMLTGFVGLQVSPISVYTEGVLTARICKALSKGAAPVRGPRPLIYHL